jgi:oxygen-independent coproporphyrinogen-3 oxidase
MQFASRHNQKYWDHTPYLGLGPAAHSFRNNQRWWNVRSLDQYIAAVNRGHPPVEETETLSVEQLRLEALYFGMRTKKGIQLQEFGDRYHCNLASEKSSMLTRLQEEELVSIQGGYLRPTRAGLALADSLSLI